MKKMDYYKKFLLYIKWMKQLIIKKKTETILNRAKDCSENNKEALRHKTKNKYKELSQEKKCP